MSRTAAEAPAQDPHAQWSLPPEADRTLPGVARWFDDRRKRDQQTEAEALHALDNAQHGHVVDVPLAGVDWPYGEPIDLRDIQRILEERPVRASEWQLYAVPDPPGTILRIRAGENASQFARDLTRLCRRRENENRAGARTQPWGALCARYSARRVGARWMSAYSRAGLTPSAPPDAIAMGLAAYGSAIALSCASAKRSALPGEAKFDLTLDPELHERSASGRRALDALAAMLSAHDTGQGQAHRTPRYWLLSPYDAEEEHPDHQQRARPRERWTIAGAGDSSEKQTVETRVARVLSALPHPHESAPEPALLATIKENDAYLCRLGLGAGATLARLDPDASAEEAARAFASQHGLTCGADTRIRRFAQNMLPQREPDPFARREAATMRLALARLATIPGDPCQAHGLLGALNVWPFNQDRPPSGETPPNASA